jgi:histidinol-phosphate phosphatase family protein
VVIRSGGRGPAAARNTGSRLSDADWVEFLDDDVIPQQGWCSQLEEDLHDAGAAVATQGRVLVPDPDPEESAKGLEKGLWITADMAYRREAFERVGGFDQRFRRAYREDADLGLRLTSGGDRIARGRRWVQHGVAPSPWWMSVSRQRGNADDALMLFLHGRDWHGRAGAPRGARGRHLLATSLLAAGIAAAIARRRRLSAVMFAGWLAITARFVSRRGNVPSSVAIPLAATWWWLFGLIRAWRLTRPPQAVLFDRDGTLIEDVPNNGDPRRVRPRPGVRPALDRLRAAGVRIGMVTNQGGVSRGLLTLAEVHAVNRKVEDLLGPFDLTLVCVHGPDDGCDCRKPKPGLVLESARRLGVRPRRCVVLGDIESDMTAAEDAGARAVLLPNQATRPEEIARANEVAFSLEQAVDRLLGSIPCAPM